MTKVARNGGAVKPMQVREIIMPANRAQAMESLVHAPEVRTAPGEIPQLGGVGTSAVSTPMQNPFVSTLRFTLDNSATGATTAYMIGDPLGMVAAILGGAYTDPDGTSAPSYTAFQRSIELSPIITKGFNYTVSTGTSAQFSEDFKYGRADIGGGFSLNPIYPETAQRNTQQNDKLLTFNQPFKFDKSSGLLINVAANTTVVLTFFVGSELNVI
ncbi:hypothetical protein [Phaeocystidibacter luteus]|uniref:Uncharacterized protein n=1 Tax=Phaeocystidibacter luteus TaxID=911197 RepID=A0A6N6RLX8_9FLAO|nr:hypothetical protein [Phaeocystidibacter luteus]KAB2814566.1 hypothetical protein F8C67_02165 [Phaeocystidibacter luteus]